VGVVLRRHVEPLGAVKGSERAAVVERELESAIDGALSRQMRGQRQAIEYGAPTRDPSGGLARILRARRAVR
jgi:hypothetical protein